MMKADTPSSEHDLADAREEAVAASLLGIIGHMIRRGQQVAVATFLARMAEFDVTPAQFVTLYVIAHLPGCDQATVARYAALDQSNVADVTKRLEHRGWVRRQQSPEDRRARVLFLTEDGRRLFGQMEPRMAEIQREVLSPLTAAEGRMLLRLLAKLSGVEGETAKPFSRASGRRQG